MVKALVCPAASMVSKSEKPSGSCAEVADFEIPTNSPKKQKLEGSAPVRIGLQLFSDNSELIGLPGYQDKVVVMMMEHNAKPCYFFKYFQAFESFLLHVRIEQQDFPESMDEFEKRYEMRFVIGSVPPLEKQRSYARGAYVKLRFAGKVIEVLDSFFVAAAT